MVRHPASFNYPLGISRLSSAYMLRRHCLNSYFLRKSLILACKQALSIPGAETGRRARPNGPMDQVGMFLLRVLLYYIRFLTCLCQGAIATYVVLELTLLVLAIVGSLHVTGLFVAASALKLAAALFMMVLSVMDHSRSPRPSILLNSYLFLTLLLDGAQARTLFLSSGGRPEITYSSIFSAALALKLGIFFLEARQKSRWVGWDVKEHSPEETSGIFSLGGYSWLNKLFLAGYSNVLKVKDLYPLDSTLNGKLLHDRFSRNLDYGGLKGDKIGLVKVLIRTLNINLLLPIPFRLAMLGFTLAQPLFTQSLLEYLSKPERDPNVGYGFIGACILIYSGIAISSALYWYDKCVCSGIMREDC